MKEMNKKNYLTPMVEIMSARVEKGFQASSTNELNGTLPPKITGNEVNFSDFD